MSGRKMEDVWYIFRTLTNIYNQTQTDDTYEGSHRDYIRDKSNGYNSLKIPEEPKIIMSRVTFLLLFISINGFCFAQSRNHSSMYLRAWPTTTSTPLLFSPYCAESSSKSSNSKLSWGLDTAWDSSDNVTRGTNYIGKDVLSTGRISFQPSDLVDADGNLSSVQRSALQSRLSHIAISGVTNVMLNCDHEALNSDNYYGKPYEWYRVIKASVRFAQSKGFHVVSISPFNEPDYTAWGEGTKDDFREICRYISEDPELAGIRISAGNTLNCDQAWSWYDYMKPYVTEGNTHQLAGSFANYASFFEKVRKEGNYASADEMHNVGEALVGVHYGLQSGVWWGYDGVARGEFCRASYYGNEIGYAENRNTWTAAAVYQWQDTRDSGQKTAAFIGSSERQANTSTYEIISSQPVFYDGYGPTYNYSVTIPGGTAYQTGQTNAERMVQIHSGYDIPPLSLFTSGSQVSPMGGDLEGAPVIIMNRNSRMCLGYYNGAKGNAIQLTQGTYTGTASQSHQHWLVRPVEERVGGDYSYFYLKSERDTTQLVDLNNWSTSAGGTLIGYAGSGGANEQWFTEYAGDGFYYIRSRHSGLYLEVKGAKTTKNVAIQQAIFTGAANQQWRFMPTDAKLSLDASAPPTNLTVTPQSASCRLSWTPSTDADVTGYYIYRDSTCIARYIQDTVFVDNNLIPNSSLLTPNYTIRSINRSGNLSSSLCGIGDRGEASALIAHLSLDKSLIDSTENWFDASLCGTATYQTILKKEGTASLSLNGTNNYLLLSKGVAASDSLTVAMWVYNRNYNSSSDTYVLDLDFPAGIAVGAATTGSILAIPAPKKYGWHHVAATIDRQTNLYILYVDGVQVSSLPYDGRLEGTSPALFKGYIDDLRFYRGHLTSAQIANLAGIVVPGDANQDGVIDVADITAIAAYILGTKGSSFSETNADVNQDGTIDVADITATASIILDEKTD